MAAAAGVREWAGAEAALVPPRKEGISVGVPSAVVGVAVELEALSMAAS